MTAEELENYFMRQFTDFVREFVYIPLLRQQIG